MDPAPRFGRLPFALGYAGLVPQIIVVLLLLSGDLTDRFVALAAGFAYDRHGAARDPWEAAGLWAIKRMAWVRWRDGPSG